jgi:hypothetical protein
MFNVQFNAGAAREALAAAKAQLDEMTPVFARSAIPTCRSR